MILVGLCSLSFAATLQLRDVVLVPLAPFCNAHLGELSVRGDRRTTTDHASDVVLIVERRIKGIFPSL